MQRERWLTLNLARTLQRAPLPLMLRHRTVLSLLLRSKRLSSWITPIAPFMYLPIPHGPPPHSPPFPPRNLPFLAPPTISLYHLAPLPLLPQALILTSISRSTLRVRVRVHVQSLLLHRCLLTYVRLPLALPATSIRPPASQFQAPNVRIRLLRRSRLTSPYQWRTSMLSTTRIYPFPILWA